MTLTLPYPPSVNHYWRHVGPRTLISKEGRKFRERVCGMLASNGPRKPPAGGRIAMLMDAFPPDRRRRDLDNLQKATLDALQHAGLYKDDSQIDLLLIKRGDVRQGGSMVVEMLPLPLVTCPLCGHRVNPSLN